MSAKIALHVLASGLVLDRSVLVTQTVAELDATVATLRASANSKKPVTVIENGATFFTSGNMLDIIKSGGQNYKLIAEKAGVTLRDEDVQAIITAEATKKAIEKSMIPPLPPYTFAAIPAGWSVKSDLDFSTGKNTTVRRTRTNNAGNGVGYNISLLQLKRVWAIAAPRWQTGTGNSSLSVTAHGTYRTVYIRASSAEIGCQTVQRYELEQLALHLGWDFPAAAK